MSVFHVELRGWKSGSMPTYGYPFDKTGDRLTLATYTNLTSSPREPFNYHLLGNRGGNAPGGDGGYGSVPHGGFGLGVERTLAWL